MSQKLALLRRLRKADVRNFVGRPLDLVDPELMKEIARLLDESE